MKKQIALLTLLGITLIGCSGGKSDSPLSLSVATPSGAPALAFYKHLKEDKLEINADPANVVTYMKKGSKDVIVLPTNAGVNLIKQGIQYKIGATITYGNFYLASTGNDEDGILNEGDYVVLFQENNIPDKLFKYCYSDILSTLDIHYVNAASDAATALVKGKNESDGNATVDYVLLAEPALSTALDKNAKAKQYSDIQEVYYQKSGNKNHIAQASVFIKSDVKIETAKSFLNDLKYDIEQLCSNVDTLDTYVAGIDDATLASKIGGTSAKIKPLFTKDGNRAGLGYKDGYTNKADIDAFLKMWPSIGETSEEMYIK